MHFLQKLAQHLTALERRAYNGPQLTALSRWHAESVANSGIRDTSQTRPGQARCYAAISNAAEKERVVVLGTGWAAARLAMDLNCNQFDITIVSPLNHMVFTPLLASACVGTLGLRSVAVPITALQKRLTEPQNKYIMASAQNVDPDKKIVECKDEDGLEFSVAYDKLVVATGSQGSTFGIPGVEKYAHPLRDISNADSIRNHLIANWTKANTPNRPAAERERMLAVLVVGGGPTGVEFAGELTDFINTDLRRLDKDRAADMKVTLIEAQQLLGTFDAPLRDYAAKNLEKQGVRIVKGMVKELTQTEAHLSTGEVMPYGICIWSTGVGPTSFTTSLPFAKTARGRIAIDGEMRVLQHVDPEKTGGADPSKPSDVRTSLEKHDNGHGREIYKQVQCCYALGDCCANMEQPLPALAQVAEQQGKYLARIFNRLAKDPYTKVEPFSYRHMGSMASIGDKNALIQLGDEKHFSTKGFKSYLAWKSAYLTRLGTANNRIYVLVNWLTTAMFGRDMSRW